MGYTEIQKRNGKDYYYRALSFREGAKVKKSRIYLGRNLSKKKLLKKEMEAEKELSLGRIKPKIIEILKKNKIKKAGIFGSYARGENTRKSDIDILIESPKGIGFGFVGIQFELEENLNKKIDLISYRSINPLLRKRILKEEVRII